MLVMQEEEVRHHFEKGFKLGPEPCWFKACYMTRSFASSFYRKEKYHDTEPEIKFAPRYFFDQTDEMMSTQFVVLETFGIAKVLKDTEVTDCIIKAVKSYNETPLVENSMYLAMMDNIIDRASATPSSTKSSNDFNVMVIGLEKDDYESVH